MSKTFYITTPIYYPSGRPHIGTAYTTILSDSIARYKRLQGYDVRFLTGLDEHGQKVAQVAEREGITPQAHVDNTAATFQELWQTLNISNDDFMRTTNDYHVKAVQKIFTKLEDQGDIYLSSYEGYYCTGCETYYKPEELSPDHQTCQFGHEVKLIEEECYFLRFDKYIDQLVAYYNEHENFLLPKFRKTEMLENFINPGLQDLAISRTTFDWGIKVPTNDRHVIYVWLDALTNYITNLGYLSDDDSLFQKYWQNGDEVVQIVGKDITRFHMIYWPVILKALGLRIPDHVVAHGFILSEGQKMSKSLGNVIDPYMLIDRYGVDATRYYLLREMPFGQDGSFSKKGIIQKINSEIVNDYANLVNRSVAMINKYFSGTVEENTRLDTDLEISLAADLAKILVQIEDNYNSFNLAKALENSNYYVSRLNKYIDETAPWVLAKDEASLPYLKHVLYRLSAAIIKASTFIAPVMPNLAEKALSFFNVDNATWNMPVTDLVSVVEKASPLYARLDEEEELLFLNQQIAVVSDKIKTPEVTIDTFKASELMAGEIINVKKHETADRLLVFEISFGDYTSQIVSGVAKTYPKFSDLIGQKVIAVTNLKPTKIRGVKSQGMLLTTENNGDVKIVIVDKNTPIGKRFE